VPRSDGGPAFPPNAGWRDDDLSARGMSMRDYFAAHAPEVPDWFEHTPPKRELPENPKTDELDETHRKTAEDWRRDPIFDLPEELEWWGDKVKAYADAKSRWQTENQIARLVQWRYVYADEMVEQRTKDNTSTPERKEPQ
jgi:hypothetical protein